MENQKTATEKKRIPLLSAARYLKFGNTIYGRVVLIIAILSVILLASLGIIFRSVYVQYLNTVILQNGNNVGSLVEGALYHSMLENDKSSLQSTLDAIHDMPGIEDVSMYDSKDQLMYSSISEDDNMSFHPDCLSCHKNLAEKFPPFEKSYRIITADSECKMSNHKKGQRHLIIRTPIQNKKTCYEAGCHAHSPDEKVLGSLIIKVPLREFDSAVSRSSWQFYGLAIFSTLLLASLLIMFTRREIKNPLNKLVKASSAVGNGDLNTRMEVSPTQLADMRTVSTAFNNMLEKLQAAQTELENWSHQLEYKVRKKTEELGAAQNELMHIERLASLGKLSSSVAHEINNPLSGILVYTKLVHKQLNNPELTPEKKELILKQLVLIENETKRCGDIVKGLLDFSRKDQENFEPLPLHPVLHDTAELVSHSIRIADISFTKDFTAKYDLIYCSPNQIKQACMAILVNSTEAVAAKGEIIMRTSNPDDSTIMIEIIDNGIGIAPDDLPHLFEPFFSTKQEVHGIGLGLPIAHGIIQSHNGKIQIQSELGKGTTVSIILPLIRS